MTQVESGLKPCSVLLLFVATCRTEDLLRSWTSETSGAASAHQYHSVPAAPELLGERSVFLVFLPKRRAPPSGQTVSCTCGSLNIQAAGSRMGGNVFSSLKNPLCFLCSHLDLVFLFSFPPLLAPFHPFHFLPPSLLISPSFLPLLLSPLLMLTSGVKVAPSSGGLSRLLLYYVLIPRMTSH